VAKEVVVGRKIHWAVRKKLAKQSGHKGWKARANCGGALHD